MKPKVLVLKTDGINCDFELAFAFEKAGGNAKIVHINELRSKKESLKNFQILAVPGGFSYGDDVASGKILAVELTSFFSEELKKVVARKNTLVIGICNGFQVLVRTGLLPFGNLRKMQATLSNNESGHFECRWVNLKIEPKSKCVFLGENFARLDKTVSYQVAHGEGKFFTDKETLRKIEKQGLVVYRYTDQDDNPTRKYPDNPNGSLNAIAGICDPTGRVLGMMPHPERFVVKTQHPNWRRVNSSVGTPQGLPIFENMINFVKEA